MLLPSRTSQEAVRLQTFHANMITPLALLARFGERTTLLQIEVPADAAAIAGIVMQAVV